MIRSQILKECFGIEEVVSAVEISENDDGVFAETQGECNTLLSNLNETTTLSERLSDDLQTVNVCENVISDGCTDGVTLQVIQETVESIYRRHGMRRYYRPSISKEDFDLLKEVDDRFGVAVDKAQAGVDYVKDKYNSATKAIGKDLSKLKDNILKGLSSVWEKTKETFNKYLGKKSKLAGIVNANILKAKQLIADAGEWFSQKGKLIISFFKGGVNNGGKTVSEKDFISTITKLVGTVTDSVKSWLNKVVSGIKSGRVFDFKLGDVIDSTLAKISGVAVSSKEGLLSALDSVKGIINSAMKTISECGKSTLEAIQNLQKSAGDKLSNSSLVESAKESIISAGKMIKEGTYTVCEKLSNIMDTCNSFVKNTVTSIKQNVSSWMKESKENKK